MSDPLIRAAIDNEGHCLDLLMQLQTEARRLTVENQVLRMALLRARVGHDADCNTSYAALGRKLPRPCTCRAKAHNEAIDRAFGIPVPEEPPVELPMFSTDEQNAMLAQIGILREAQASVNLDRVQTYTIGEE